MGKKNKKNPGGTGSDYFDYAYGVGEAKSLMKRYGVEGVRSVKPDNIGATPDSYNRSVKDVKKDIASAMMNDYDTRRSMEAAALMGNKDAKKFAKKGFKAGNIYDAYGTMRDLKKEYVGGGGMDGPKNRAGLTQALVQADRDAFSSDIDSRIEAANRAAQFEANQPERDTESEYEFSEELATARGTIDAFNDFAGGGGLADMLSGDAQASADRFRQQRADNIKQYLKPNPVSQLGKGLDAQGLFRPV